MTSNYFGIPAEFSSPENSKTIIIPVPYETATSRSKGTKNGPGAILSASQHIKWFDDELWVEPYKIGIQTISPLAIAPVEAETKDPFTELRNVVLPTIEFAKFPIIVGGEHSLSLGAVRACAERYRDLSVLQIDAHTDCHQSYKGNPYNHACVAYQIHKILPQPLITQVGVRNISGDEVSWMEEEKPKINIFWAHNMNHWNFNEIVATLSENVYLSIDLSGLDSGIMPATGNPNPGGLNWHQLIALIKVLCIRKNVVAADIVELSPIKGLLAPDFLAAKLIYKLIGYKFALDLGVSKKYL